MVCAPSGDIMLVSPAMGGRTTDAELVHKCKLVTYLKEGDRVLADKVKLVSIELNHIGGITCLFPIDQ